ncbi:MAG: zinc-ribbon domain-containing protein [Bacteroidales bacterium]|nr:zinc-ribbon domain-containing protein [Bacteroidales bacterium]
MSYDTSIEYLYPELRKEWSDKNDILPSSITRGSEKKIWWKCAIDSHPDYLATPYSRIKLKSGCPICGKLKSQLSRKMRKG